MQFNLINSTAEGGTPSATVPKSLSSRSYKHRLMLRHHDQLVCLKDGQIASVTVMPCISETEFQSCPPRTFLHIDPQRGILAEIQTYRDPSLTLTYVQRVPGVVAVSLRSVLKFGQQVEVIQDEFLPKKLGHWPAVLEWVPTRYEEMEDWIRIAAVFHLNEYDGLWTKPELIKPVGEKAGEEWERSVLFNEVRERHFIMKRPLLWTKINPNGRGASKSVMYYFYVIRVSGGSQLCSWDEIAIEDAELGAVCWYMKEWLSTQERTRVALPRLGWQSVVDDVSPSFTLETD